MTSRDLLLVAAVALVSVTVGAFAWWAGTLLAAVLCVGLWVLLADDGKG